MHASDLENIPRRYGWRRVVVASDSVRERRAFLAALDPSLVAETPTQRENTLFGDGLLDRNVMVEQLLRSRHGWENATSPQWDAFESFILDLHAMVRCDAVVAKFTSNMARLTLELMSARMGRVAPFISLDAPWCFGGRGASPHGRGFFPC